MKCVRSPSRTCLETRARFLNCFVDGAAWGNKERVIVTGVTTNWYILKYAPAVFHSSSFKLRVPDSRLNRSVELWPRRGSPNLQKVRGRASWAERCARVSVSVLTHMQAAVRLLPAQSIKLKRRKHDTGMKYLSETGRKTNEPLTTTTTTTILQMSLHWWRTTRGSW